MHKLRVSALVLQAFYTESQTLVSTYGRILRNCLELTRFVAIYRKAMKVNQVHRLHVTLFNNIKKNQKTHVTVT